MERIIIGCCIFFGGLLMILTIIVMGSMHAVHVTEWVGRSKLWSVIFGSERYIESLYLDFPFVVGVLLGLLGLIILGIEYYKSFTK